MREEEKGARERRPGAYAGAIVGNIVALWLVNSIPGWDWRFVTSDFPAVLWAMNLSIGVQIAGNALLLFFHPRFLHYLVQALFNAVSVLALLIFVTVYPFAFNAVVAWPMDTIVRIVLYVALVGTAIAAVVNAVRAVWSLVTPSHE